MCLVAPLREARRGPAQGISPRDHEDVPLYPYRPAWEMPLYPYPPAWEMPLPCADAGFPIRTLPINAPDAVITTSFLDAHQGARFLKGR